MNNTITLEEFDLRLLKQRFIFYRNVHKDTPEFYVESSLNDARRRLLAVGMSEDEIDALPNDVNLIFATV